MAKKINLLFNQSNQNSFRGIGFYSEELKKRLKASPEINLVTQKRKADIIHYPDFHLFTKINISHLKKTIFTIHDLTPLELPNLFPLGIKSRLSWWHNKHNLKKSLHIITDSKSSKNQITKFTNLKEDKVTSIYLAPRSSLKPKKTKKPKEKFALYVGDVNPNKNIKKMVIACLTNNLPLYIVGKSAAQKITKNKNHPELKDLVWLQRQKKLHPQLIKFLGFVSDKRLASLYQTATVCLQVSIAEGFGLPVIEALSLGCPVLTSNTSSLPEVGGKACFYVTPNHQEQINKKLLKIINLSEASRKKIIKLGKDHAKKFTWEKTAQDTINLYKSLL